MEDGAILADGGVSSNLNSIRPILVERGVAWENKVTIRDHPCSSWIIAKLFVGLVRLRASQHPIKFAQV